MEGGDELFDSNCKPAADASHYGRGHNRVLLRGAAGLGGFKSCGVRRALSDELIDARSIGDPLISARLLDAPDVVAL